MLQKKQTRDEKPFETGVFTPHLSEQGFREEDPFPNTIGGPSRGV